jgi:hypothetical protein
VGVLGDRHADRHDTDALAEEKDTIDSILADIEDKGTDERKSAWPEQCKQILY